MICYDMHNVSFDTYRCSDTFQISLHNTIQHTIQQFGAQDLTPVGRHMFHAIP